MLTYIKKNKLTLMLLVMILAYIIYFSWFTVMRYRTLHASYFDLGIMHQTVYNSFMAIKTNDWSRFLELTNPHGFEQVKRMAIHNDMILGLLALLYFIYSGPETLLIFQTIILALGAIPLYLIANYLLSKKSKNNSFIPLVISFVYLMSTPMQRANIFDFHAVTIATTTLLFMYYFWLVKKYWLSGLFLIISLLTKEQVALTTGFFGIYISYKIASNYFVSRLHPYADARGVPQVIAKKIIYRNLIRNYNFRDLLFGFLVIVISLSWFIVSMKVIVPYFRGSVHFALQRYGDFGDTTEKVFLGLISHPASLIKYIWHIDTARYFWFLLGPLGFLSLLSPTLLAITIPEFAINLLSKSWNMRNIIYHYTAVLQPWIFIAAVSSITKIILFCDFTPTKVGGPPSHCKKNNFCNLFCRINNKKLIISYLLITSIIFTYFKGPLPFSQEAEINLWSYSTAEAQDVSGWVKKLSNDNIKVSSTGNLSPFFSSRRYFYNFSEYYYLADYIVIRPNEIFSYADKNIVTPAYRQLQSDKRFMIIYKVKNFEVYEKL